MIRGPTTRHTADMPVLATVCSMPALPIAPVVVQTGASAFAVGLCMTNDNDPDLQLLDPSVTAPHSWLGLSI